MKITGFDISRIEIELKKPFITSSRRVDSINDIIIRVHTDSNLVGYGAACAVTAITGNTNEDVIKDLKETIFPKLLNKEINISTCRFLNNLHVESESKACVDIALYDLLAKETQQSLHTYLGARTSQLQTDLTISVNEPELMLKMPKKP